MLTFKTGAYVPTTSDLKMDTTAAGKASFMQLSFDLSFLAPHGTITAAWLYMQLSSVGSLLGTNRAAGAPVDVWDGNRTTAALCGAAPCPCVAANCTTALRVRALRGCRCCRCCR